MEALQDFAQHLWASTMSEDHEEVLVHYGHDNFYPIFTVVLPMPFVDPTEPIAMQYSHPYQHDDWSFFPSSLAWVPQTFPTVHEEAQSTAPLNDPAILYTLKEVPEHGDLVDPAIIAVGPPKSGGSVLIDDSIMETSTIDKEHFQGLLEKLRSSDTSVAQISPGTWVEDSSDGSEQYTNATSVPAYLAKLFESDRRSKRMHQQHPTLSTKMNPDAPVFVPRMNPEAAEFVPPASVNAAESDTGIYVFSSPESLLGSSKAFERIPGENGVPLTSPTLIDKMERVSNLLPLANAMGITLSDEDVDEILAAPMVRSHVEALAEPEVQSIVPAEEDLFTDGKAEVVVNLPWHMSPSADVRAEILKNVAERNPQPPHRVVIDLEERGLENSDDDDDEPLESFTPGQPRIQYNIPMTGKALNESINMVMPRRFQLSESWTNPVVGHRSPPSPLSYVENAVDEEPDNVTASMEGEFASSCPTPDRDSDGWSVVSASLSNSVSSLGEQSTYFWVENDGKETIMTLSIADE